MQVCIKNPHSVLAALQNRPEDVKKFHFSIATKSETWQKVFAFAQQVLPAHKREKMLRASEDTNQLIIKPKLSCELLSCFQKPKRFFLALDCIQDPQNVGSIFRSAAFFGVEGIFISEHRSATLTSTVYDVASGGIEQVDFYVVPNIKHALEVAKKNDFWVLGTSDQATVCLSSVSLNQKWVCVLGNEQSGLRPSVQKMCDSVIKIPGVSPLVSSLNVGVAAGILCHWFTQK